MAFRSANPEKPFNLTIEEAKVIGAAIGCDFFLLVEAVNLKRYSSILKEYYESYAVIYAVSSRSGRLIFWTLKTFNGKTPAEADELLSDSLSNLTEEIAEKAKQTAKYELAEKPPENYLEIPYENSPEAKNFRPPLPYRRISPIYTETARFYRVEATVDVEIYLDEAGNIKHLEIVRWAGFGLDESVAETVRQMNWRPAEINGKPVPIRALLRYNFRKPEK
jgi:TonB family protein